MKAFALLLGLCAPAYAADFRALDIGAPCVSIADYEVKLGSAPLGSHSPGEVFWFKAHAFDRAMNISYFCVRGKLFAGNYYFPIELLSAAAATYDDTYQKLMSLYGSPFLDNVRWGPVDAPVDASPEKRPRDVAAWKTERIHVSLSIQPSLKGEAIGWRTFVVVTSAHPDPSLRSNKSLERP